MKKKKRKKKRGVERNYLFDFNSFAIDTVAGARGDNRGYCTGSWALGYERVGISYYAIRLGFVLVGARIRIIISYVRQTSFWQGKSRTFIQYLETLMNTYHWHCYNATYMIWCYSFSLFILLLSHYKQFIVCILLLW